MSNVERRQFLKSLVAGLAAGTVVLARAVPVAEANHASTGTPEERADRLADDSTPTDDLEPIAFLNGAFRNGGGFRNGGFRNGGFRNGSFANGGWRNGSFANGAFRNGSFRNGAFRNW